MTKHREPEYADLRAELDALRQQVQVLETAQARDTGIAQPRYRRAVPRRTLMVALPVLLLFATAGVLYGDAGTQALFVDPSGRVGINTPKPGNTLDVRGGAHVASLSFIDGEGVAYRDNWIGMAANIDGATKWLHIGGITDGGVRRIALYADTILASGRVGIGKITPDTDSRLDVEGVVKAKGFSVSGIPLSTVPVGTIMAYGGNTANAEVIKQLQARGWLPCDGALVETKTYPDLFAAISTAFGANDAKTSFRVPDLRGRFLRGDDQGTNRDPDVNGRAAINAGGNSRGVGSVQGDEFKRHTHGYDKFPVNEVPGNGRAGGSHWAGAGAQTAAAGGNETRPKNVSVNWIIKAKEL
jgi:hypothetical protein